MILKKKIQNFFFRPTRGRGKIEIFRIWNFANCQFWAGFRTIFCSKYSIEHPNSRQKWGYKARKNLFSHVTSSVECLLCKPLPNCSEEVNSQDHLSLLAATRIHALKREFLQLLIVRDDLGNSVLPNNLGAVCKANTLHLTSRVRKGSSAPCSLTSVWNSDAQYCI